MSKLDPTAIKITTDPLTERMKGTTYHGNADFDVPYISSLADNLFQGGCKDGLILPSDIKHVVSLYQWEAYTFEHDVDSYMRVLMYDSGSQGFHQVEAIARWVNFCRETGPVLVHCQAGLNRSSLIAARALMLGGLTAEEAITLVREKRSPVCLINKTFESYLLSL